ncbi:hypothetical protein [Sorangium sp. So ce861]|uniref:hypothetical protein n=1 Tax=Sorangium sp. So ce861 TaxID=3133323 RepID=UPI003F61CB78
MNLRDPKHRMELTFPGKPVTRRVSPLEIEAYLRTKGYTPAILGDRTWPKKLPYSWWPPEPDSEAPRPHTKCAKVPGARECSRPLETVIEAIASNEGRTPGEVLRDIKALAKERKAGSTRRDPQQAADAAAVSIRLAGRLGELAGLLHKLAHRAGDIRDELRRMVQNVVAEHERLILQRAASMLLRPIDELNEAAAYIDRRGSPRS